MKNVNIFLSYCWKDKEIADEIFEYFKSKQDVELHRDVVDIGAWGSIKEYMQSIGEMDYVILLISDAYLKSSNCMYEVLETMRDRKYKEKIFPAVVNTEIYKPIARVEYVKFWQNEFDKLNEGINGLRVQNLGKLNEDLKRYQDIASSIAEFLDVVADMNNPRIQAVNLRIEDKLKNSGALNTNIVKKEDNLFEKLGIQKNKFQGEPSDLDINQFIKESYEQIIALLLKLCQQYADEYKNIQIQFERIDSRTTIYKFYNNGRLVRGLKVFFSNLLGRQEAIGIADCTISIGSGNNSFNGMYEAKVVDGELKLSATMSVWNRELPMSSQEVVADIWKNYVHTYLE